MQSLSAVWPGGLCQLHVRMLSCHMITYTHVIVNLHVAPLGTTHVNTIAGCFPSKYAGEEERVPRLGSALHGFRTENLNK